MSRCRACPGRVYAGNVMATPPRTSRLTTIGALASPFPPLPESVFDDAASRLRPVPLDQVLGTCEDLIRFSQKMAEAREALGQIPDPSDEVGALIEELDDEEQNAMASVGMMLGVPDWQSYTKVFARFDAVRDAVYARSEVEHEQIVEQHKQTQRRVHWQIERALSPAEASHDRYGLDTTERLVLRYAALAGSNDGYIDARESIVTESIGVDSAAVTHAIESLNRKGLIEVAATDDIAIAGGGMLMAVGGMPDRVMRLNIAALEALPCHEPDPKAG